MLCHESKSRDLTGRLLPAILVWGLPVGAILWSGYTHIAMRWLWPLAFGFMGAACIWNAARCRRVHCYFTGPLFLVAAALSALHGFGVLSLGANGYGWIANGALVGACVLICVTEGVLGRYRARPS